MDLSVSAEYFIIEVNQPKILEFNLINDNSKKGRITTPEYAGFIIINNKTNTQSWSPHFYKTLGYRANEIQPSFESLERIVHPSDFVIIEKIFKHFEHNIDKKFSIKLRYKTKSKTYIILNSSIKVINNEELKIHTN